jgi:hypothetical protein
LRIGLRSLFLSLEFNDLDLRDVIGKVYLEDNSGAIEQLDFEVTDLEFTLNTRVEPEKVLVHLLSKSTGEVLDYRRIYLSWREFPKGVTLDRWGSDFMDIIKNGESQTTELKREVGNSPRGIIETIIAFSNSYGGLIFIGVDDDTEIYGINDKGIRDQITNAIADCCDPPIIPEIYTINLEGKDVVVIEVEEGDDKPYTFRNRGIFVRRNGTTRIASRFEYDSLNSKNRNYPYNPL